MSENQELPAGWCWTTVEDVIEWCRYGTSAKATSKSDGIPVLRMGNIVEGTIKHTDLKYLPTSHREFPVLLLRKGDLLFNRTNSAELVGKSAVYTGSPDPCSFASYLIALRLSRACDPKFLSFCLNSLFGRVWVRSVASQQVGQANVSATKLRSFQFPLAPRTEQRRIVAKIEELFSDLDAGVAALERVRANLKRYRASLLKAAVEGRLTEQWRRRNPPAEPASQLLQRILEQRRRKWEEEQLAKYEAKGKKPPKNWRENYKEPAAPDVRNLPELPDGWCWATVDAISEVCGGLTKGQKRSPGALVREVPYLRVANVQRGFLDLSEMKMIQATPDEIEKLRLTPGDILFTEGGDRDKLGRGWVWRGEIEECIHQNHVFRVRPHVGDLQSEFVSCHGNTFGRFWFLKAGRQSVNLASINMTILKRFPVPLPPICEQKEIVQILQNESVWLEHCITQIDSSLCRASNLRHSILREAFQGNLVAQDPSDEPVDVLLERIRAQRSTQPKPARKRKISNRQLSIPFQEPR